MSRVGGYKVNMFRFVGLLIITQIMFGMISFVLSALTPVENLENLDRLVYIGFLLIFIGCVLLSVERR